MTVSRPALVAAAIRAGLPRPQAVRAVSLVTGGIERALRARRAVRLNHFGTFSFRPSRRASMYDPRTGSRKPVRERFLLRFRPAPRFLRRLRFPR